MFDLWPLTPLQASSPSETCMSSSRTSWRWVPLGRLWYALCLTACSPDINGGNSPSLPSPPPPCAASRGWFQASVQISWVKEMNRSQWHDWRSWWPSWTAWTTRVACVSCLTRSHQAFLLTRNDWKLCFQSWTVKMVPSCLVSSQTESRE